MSNSSRIPGFYKLPPNERRDAIEAHADLETDEVKALDAKALSVESADLMVEDRTPNGVAMEVTQFSCLRGKVNNRTSVTSSVRAYRTEDGGDDDDTTCDVIKKRCTSPILSFERRRRRENG